MTILGAIKPMSNVIVKRTEFLDDEQVIKKVLNHIENQTTDLGSTSWREPTKHYTESSRLALELDLLKSRFAVFCPSAAIPKRGSYIARKFIDVSLLVVRGKDGIVRAFKNACRHRGVQVAFGSGAATSFVCPYHAWTYGLDGSLRGVPHLHGFPELDKCTKGLVAVGCKEVNGIIMVNMAEKSEATERSSGHAFADVPDLLTDEYSLYSHDETEVPANWKLVLESFLEGYHIRSTHRDTFFQVQYDNLNVVEHCGKHSRLTFPYRPIEALKAKAVHEWSVDGRLTYVYHLFPNVLMTTHPGFNVLVVLEPVTVDITRQHTFVLTGVRHENEALRKELDSVISLVNAAVEEDRAMVISAQKGLETGANDFFEFGLFESAICHFHANMQSALKALQSGLKDK